MFVFIIRRPLPIDPEILRNCKQVQNVGHAPNPRTRRRNQCMYAEGKAKEKLSTDIGSPLRRSKKYSVVQVMF